LSGKLNASIISVSNIKRFRKKMISFFFFSSPITLNLLTQTLNTFSPLFPSGFSATRTPRTPRDVGRKPGVDKGQKKNQKRQSGARQVVPQSYSNSNTKREFGTPEGTQEGTQEGMSQEGMSQEGTQERTSEVQGADNRLDNQFDTNQFDANQISGSVSFRVREREEEKYRTVGSVEMGGGGTWMDA
jgi:hypothetical protein